MRNCAARAAQADVLQHDVLQCSLNDFVAASHSRAYFAQLLGCASQSLLITYAAATHTMLTYSLNLSVADVVRFRCRLPVILAQFDSSVASVALP